MAVDMKKEGGLRVRQEVRMKGGEERGGEGDQ